MIIEGYAALFGVADQMADIVRAGAFARAQAPLPMYVEHEKRLRAGVWSHVREDARGLYVRGEIDDNLPGAARAKRMIARGIDGLSIGFVPVVAHKTIAGRSLDDVELLEVSIVTNPMQPLARLSARAKFIGARPDAKPEATFAGRAHARLTLARAINRAA
ncbi:MAG: HK97 family phage prohead protease [Proteobacteria bacterium]|nr:HK97 family phage prohead protease [Pseudomonadota bacterium]